MFLDIANNSTVTLSALSLRTASLASLAQAVSYLTSSAVFFSVPWIVLSWQRMKKKSVYGYPLTATYFLVYYNLIITLFLQSKEYLCNINNFVLSKQKCIDYIVKMTINVHFSI